MSTNHSFIFILSDLLNGKLELSQNGTLRNTEYVSSQQPVTHTISLKEGDQHLVEKAAYNRVHWFVDCVYMEQTEDFTFTNSYIKENGKYEVEALLVVSYEPVS